MNAIGPDVMFVVYPFQWPLLILQQQQLRSKRAERASTFETNCCIGVLCATKCIRRTMLSTKTLLMPTKRLGKVPAVPPELSSCPRLNLV